MRKVIKYLFIFGLFFMVAGQLTAVNIKADTEKKQSVSLTIGLKHLELSVGEAYTLKPTILPKSASKSKITYVSGNTKVATVNQYGTIKAKGKGTAKITAKLNNGIKDTIIVTVKKESVPVERAFLSKTRLVQKPGDQTTLKVTLLPENATSKKYTLVSTNKKVVKVTNKGNVTFLSPGQATIKVMVGKKSLATCSVLVKEIVPVTIGNKTIKLWDSIEKAEKMLGKPNRIDQTGKDYELYVYNEDYQHFYMLAVRKKEVVGIYTDAVDFTVKKLQAKDTLADVNRIFDKKEKLGKEHTANGPGWDLRILMDTVDTKKVEGIFLTSYDIEGFSAADVIEDEVLEDMELEIWDLTNSYRVRRGKTPLKWSDDAAKAARDHSTDMAKNQFFDHTGSDQSSMSERMKKQGIEANYYGENIAAGYHDAISYMNGWVNSPGHARNMAQEDFGYLGVGGASTSKGEYLDYFTQNFYGR